VVAAGCAWVSGQIALDPSSGRLVEGGINDQTRQVLENLRRILEAAGSDLERVIKCTVYLTDLGDFDAVNAVYAEFFPQRPPARVCVEVSALPKGARVEIDAVAALS
jgi:2-iminobutanoate/2-iminopropanoate deaminase